MTNKPITPDPLDFLQSAPDALRDMAEKAPDRADALRKLAASVEKLAEQKPAPRKQRKDRP